MTLVPRPPSDIDAMPQWIQDTTIYLIEAGLYIEGTHCGLMVQGDGLYVASQGDNAIDYQKLDIVWED